MKKTIAAAIALGAFGMLLIQFLLFPQAFWLMGLSVVCSFGNCS